MSFKELLLNTPQKYWLIVFGYHIHKSFWGVVFTLLGLIFQKYFLFLPGAFLLFLSIAGHIYTNNKPYFKLWDKM